MSEFLNATRSPLFPDYELRMTCGACPEQYDVYRDGEKVAYFRLRHGSFTASVPDSGGDVVYGASPRGDGIFEDHERERYLTVAIAAVDARLSGIDACPHCLRPFA